MADWVRSILNAWFLQPCWTTLIGWAIVTLKRFLWWCDQRRSIAIGNSPIRIEKLFSICLNGSAGQKNFDVGYLCFEKCFGKSLSDRIVRMRSLSFVREVRSWRDRRN
ncbi:hypothetical protein [Leptolyngbya sp. FACHB-17]|uniref:hypothetical protein n=1 Tax=Leptolyngbya sp. FACHB-17 TaxID=2692803 RepID=UPI001681A08F|nr:hypothetical protein [Leptolyngbya sp. FACHB-17]MBD2082268.1 hypothetical protein [Leptolyngbya sp. FACHB-17]